MKKLFIFITLMFWVTDSFAKPIEKIVTVKTKTGMLEGTLLSTNNKGTEYVALIIAGSGPTDRNGNNTQMTNNSLKMLAEGLLNNGISSLRYDKRGIGKSKSAALNERELRFEHYVDDVTSWVNYLNQQGEFNKIVVIGHSEGSLLGMIAAQQKKVNKFVSLAGAGQAIDLIIREQLKAQPPVLLELSTPILDKLLQGKMVENVPPMLNSLFRPSVQPYLISWFKFDPQKEIAKLMIPVLIVQGSTDLQVSIKDADKLAQANNKATKIVIEQMNHILKEAPLDRQLNFQTYTQADLPIKPELIQVVSQFILN